MSWKRDTAVIAVAAMILIAGVLGSIAVAEARAEYKAKKTADAAASVAHTTSPSAVPFSFPSIGSTPLISHTRQS